MKKITDVLISSTLSKIVQRANLLNDLNQTIPKLLPIQYAGLYRVANLVDNQIYIEVQSAVVRQGLLLQEAQLLSRIQQRYPQITQCIFRVSPSFSPV